MIFHLPAGESPAALQAAHPEAPFTDLPEYVAYKTGRAAAELEAEAPEHFRMIEEEALRDLVVMSEITGTPRIVRLGASTLDNPECRRLLGVI